MTEDDKDEVIRLLEPDNPLHFKGSVGLLFAVIRVSSDHLRIDRLPVHNDWTALAVVRKTEQRSDFYAWAVHPLTGELHPLVSEWLASLPGEIIPG